MKPRKSKNTYAVYIGIPSLGRIAVLPSMKQARKVGTYYAERGIHFRILRCQRKEVIAP